MSALGQLRATAWTLRAAHEARRQLRAGGVGDLRLPPVPPVSARAEPAVRLTLRLTRATCLVAVAVRQSWHAAHGRPRAMVVGVTSPSAGFAAHAWLEGDPPGAARPYHELLRFPPPTDPSRTGS